MSKNLFRKGLAISAAAALSLTGVVAISAPASANGLFVQNYVTLLPTSGTAYRVLANDSFDLKSNVVGLLAGTSDKNLKFYVKDTASATRFDVDVNGAASATEAAVTVASTGNSKAGSVVTISSTGHGLATGDAVRVTTAATAGVPTGLYTVTVTGANAFTITVGNETALGTADLSTPMVMVRADVANIDATDLVRATTVLGSPRLIGTTAVVASSIGGVSTTSGRLANGDYVVDTNVNSNSNDRIFRLVNIDTTKTASVDVTAWVDDNDNNAIDPSEYVSETRTVSFHINSDLTVTTTLEQPVLGSRTIGATVAVAPELNGQQVGNTDVTAAFTAQSTLPVSAASTYNTTSKAWDVVGTLDGSTVVVAGNYTARGSVNAAAIGNTSTAVAAVAVSVDTEMVVAGTNDTTYTYDADASSSDPVAKVRPTKSATVTVTAYGTGGVATGKPVGAGRSVSVLFTDATTATTWTVNGTTILATGHGGSVTRTYTTDANGQVKLEVKSGAAANSNAITIEARPEGLTAGAAAKMDLLYETAVFNITDVNNAADDSDDRTMGAGDTYTYTLLAADQYGAPLTGDYRIQLSTTGRAVTGGNFALANGVATIPVADAALGSSSNIVATFALQKNTAGTWAASSDATAFGTSTITVNTTATALVPAITYVGGASPATLSPKAIQAYHIENFQGDFVNPAGTVVGTLALAGTGVGAGEVVTVSGSGLFFAYNDAAGGTAGIVRVVKDSMTFVVDSTSDNIQIFSNQTGVDKVVTMASRGRTGTAKVSFSAALPAAGKNITFTAPKSVKAGRTLSVTVRVTDEFGNPVNAGTASTAVGLSYDGPGFVVAGLSDTSLGADGAFTFRVLLGAQDRGPAAFSLSYNAGASNLTDATVVTSSTAVWVGPIANAKAGAKAGRVIVEAYRAKGKTVSVFVGATRVATYTADKANFSAVVRGINSGTRNVRVVLSGPGEDFRGAITVK